MVRSIFSVTSAFLLGLSSPVAAATLQVSGGILTGATGVDVDGSLYNVSLVDGTCASVYGVCDAAHFDFTTQSGAFDAARALMEQVFVDGPAGNFDTHPEDIYGCTGTDYVCYGVVPYAPDTLFYDFSEAAFADNWSDLGDGVSFGEYITDDSSADQKSVYARFTLSQAVPEPSTWLSMLLGFGVLAFPMRWRKVGAAFKNV